MAVGAAPPIAGAQTRAGFDLDNGDVFFEILYPTINPAARRFVSANGMDAPQVLRVTTLVTNAWFDAVAPYHPTAVGIYSRLGRRPASERATKRQRNIAILYGSYRVLNSVLPQNAAGWRDMLSSAGLDPSDDQENTTSPVGIGNLAGKGVVAGRAHDGMNQLGDEGGRRYNRKPYEDYTGYRPVNTPYDLRNPSRWQPELGTNNTGKYTAQAFAIPQWSRTKPYSYPDPKAFLAPPPRDSDHHNRKGYKRQADEILAASAGLTEEQKLKAEFFNDKFRGLGYPTAREAQRHKFGVDEYVHASAAGDIAAFDAGIAVWWNKYRYDAVRPATAIRYLYGSRQVTAWGGPGKGTVKDIPANEWQSYLGVPDHSEYPSGSTAMCEGVVQVGRRFHGTEQVDIPWRFTKGSSEIEPGITPAADRDLRWTTWSEFAKDCGLSRLLGGVHFPSAIEASRGIGRRVGDLAYDFVRKHVEGKPDARS